MLLSPAEAAKRLSEQTGRPITPTTLRNWRAAGKGPKVTYFHGKWPTYSPEDLEAFYKQSVDESGFRRTARRTSVTKRGSRP